MDPPQTPAVSNPASPGWSRSIERLRTATAGRFTILRELGRGGFATVFLAQQHQPSRRVAIKLLSPAHLDSDWALEHFRGESQKIAEWRHQAVVTIYEVHEEDALLYFVMSYVEGASLHELIQLLGPLPVSIVRSVLAQVGSALHYAHRQGVTHRDIKPHNILVDVDGGAVVTDFGIAKQADGPSHTVTGMIVGTAPYMAPEQCESGRTSSASDQYALGIVAYEMLVGTPPFTGAPMSVLMAHLQQPVPSIGERRPDCPPELAAAVERMLAKKPTERFDSVAAAVFAAGAAELSDVHPDRRWFAESARRLAARQQTPVLDIVSMPAAIEVGECISIGAQARTPAGEPLADVAVEWSSGREGLVSLDPALGTLVGVQPGITTVVVRGGGVEQQIQLEVRPAIPAVVMIEGPERTIRPGDRAPLRGVVTSVHGAPVQTALHWRSEQPRLATVSAEGELHAHAAGRVRIVASTDSANGEYWLDIAPALVDRIRITGDAGPLLVGEQRQFAALVLDARGQPLGDRVVRWSSTDSEIALVSAAGQVTACASGEVAIEADCEDRTATLQLAIREPPVTAVELAVPSTALHTGDRIRVQATVRAADGRPLSREVVWRSEHPAIATVDAAGTVTAVAPGVASLAALCEGVRSTVRLAVLPDAPAFALPVQPGPGTPDEADADGRATPAGDVGVAAGVTSWMPAPAGPDVAAASGAAAIEPPVEHPVATPTDAPTERMAAPTIVPATPPPAAPGIEPEVEPEIEPEIEPEVEPAIAPEIRPEVEPDTEPEVEPGVGVPALPAADVAAAAVVAAAMPPAWTASTTTGERESAGTAAGAAGFRWAYVVGGVAALGLATLVFVRGGSQPPAGPAAEDAPPATASAPEYRPATGPATDPAAAPPSAPAPVTAAAADDAPATATPLVVPVGATAPADDRGPRVVPPSAVAAAAVAASPLVVRATASQLHVGDSLAVRATRDGQPAGPVSWRSTDQRVVTVSATGMVRARSAGRAGIVATGAGAGSGSDTLLLTVQPRPPAPQVAAERPAAQPPADAPASPAPTAPQAGGYPAAGATGGAATPAPAAAAEAAEEQLRGVVNGYAAALRGRSLDDALRLYPTMTQRERDGWRSFFDFARDLQVGMRVETLAVDGATATARVAGEYRYTNPATRRPCQQPLTLQIRFARSGAGWLINGIDQQQGRGSGC